MGPSAPDSPVGLAALDEVDPLLVGGGGLLACWVSAPFVTAGVARDADEVAGESDAVSRARAV